MTKYVGIWDLDEYWMPKQGEVKGGLTRVLDELSRTSVKKKCPPEELCYNMFQSVNAGIHPHYKSNG